MNSVDKILDMVATEAVEEVGDGNHYFDPSRAPTRGRFVIPADGIPLVSEDLTETDYRHQALEREDTVLDYF